MQISTLDNQTDQSVSLVLAGRFDAHEAELFRTSIEETLQHGTTKIHVNLSEVEFVDSTALAELVRGMKRCREQQGDLVLVDPSHPVRIILELTKLDAAFSII